MKIRKQLGVASLVICTATYAGIPKAINHQGLIEVDGERYSGTGLFKFAIVDPDAPLNVWSNDGSITNAFGGIPGTAVSLAVSNGVYSVLLGDTTVTNMTSEIPPSIFADDNLVLRIWFDDDGPNPEQRLEPDVKLSSVPAAFRLPGVFVNDAGSVGIGTQDPLSLVDVTNGDIVVNNGRMRLTRRVGDPTPPGYLLTDDNTGRGWFLGQLDGGFNLFMQTVGGLNIGDVNYVTGNVLMHNDLTVGGTIINPSDIRFKDNIKPISESLSRILALRGVSYNWKQGEFPKWRFDKQRHVGLIAQDVQTVIPEAVAVMDDGYLGVDYGRVTPVLVEAVKEMHERMLNKDCLIEQQESEIGKLKKRLARLESLILNSEDRR